jgi:ubiquitin-protein ligase
MSTGIKKLQEEYKFIRKKGALAIIGATATPFNKDFLHWYGCFNGPKNTPYSDGLFYFEIKLTNEYPTKGPIDVQMRTPIYHPNIDSSNGHICVSYLSDWKSTYDIVGIVNAIIDLLDDPNPGSAYNTTNIQKAIEFKNKYAKMEQHYNWNTDWNKGWSLI